MTAKKTTFRKHLMSRTKEDLVEELIEVQSENKHLHLRNKACEGIAQNAKEEKDEIEKQYQWALEKKVEAERKVKELLKEIQEKDHKLENSNAQVEVCNKHIAYMEGVIDVLNQRSTERPIQLKPFVLMETVREYRSNDLKGNWVSVP